MVALDVDSTYGVENEAKTASARLTVMYIQ